MRDVKAVSPGDVGAPVPICPRCGKTDLRRSYVRFYERPWKAFTANRPYRCAGCGARVWRPVANRAPVIGRAGLENPAAASLDLSAIDRALERHRVKEN